MAGQRQRQAVEGLHGDAARLGPDQRRQPPAQLQRGVAVVAEHQHGLRRHAAHAQQPGDPVHDHARLAGAGAGEHEQIGLVAGGDDRLLRRVAERLDDGAEGLGRGLDLQLLLAAGEVAAQEGLLAEREVGTDQLQRLRDAREGQPRVLGHHVHLQRARVVVGIEQRVVADRVAPAPGFGRHAQRHRAAEHRQPLLQRDHLLLVQVQQRALDRGQRIADAVRQQRIGFQRRAQVFEREVDQQHVLLRRIGRHAREQRLQQALRQRAAQLRGFADRAPGAAQAHAQPFAPERAQRQAGLARRESDAIERQAFQQLAQQLGIARQALVEQALVQRPQMQRPFLAAGIGGGFRQQADQRRFDRADLLEAAHRAALAAGALRSQPGGELQAELQQAGTVHVIEQAQHRHRLLVRPGAQRRQLRERIDAQAVVGIGLQQHGEHRFPAPARTRREIERIELRARLGHRADRGPALEHAGAVLVALDQLRLLQPRERGAHAGVGIFGLEAGEQAVAAQQLAGGDDDRLVGIALLLQAAQRAQDAGDVLPAQAAARTPAELPFDVLGRVQQHAVGRLAIAPGAAGLLQVVLQRRGRIGVDDEAHVGLVDAHAEGIGRADHAQLAGEEALLHRTLVRCLHAAVKGFGRPAFAVEEAGELDGAVLLRAVDDRRARRVFEALAQQLQHLRRLAGTRDRAHLEAQVVTLDAAGVQRQLQPEFLPEVAADLVDHVRLGGGGDGADRRQRQFVPLAELADEARAVQVIGPEVVAPLRQAVRLVEHPGADLAAFEEAAEARVAKLLGRDVQHGDVAELHALDQRTALGWRQVAVQRAAELEADAPVQAIDLILHQRAQRRDHHRQRAAVAVTRERRHLIAQRLAAAGRQDAEQRAVPEPGSDDRALQAAALGRGRLGAEVRKTEPAFELPARVVRVATPGAGRIAAGLVAQAAHGLRQRRKPVPQPGRQHRIAAGDHQPGDEITEQRPQPRLHQQRLQRRRAPAPAGAGVDQALDQRAGIGRRPAAEALPEPQESRRRQAVAPGRRIGPRVAQQIGPVRPALCARRKGRDLFEEHPAGQPGIGNRVVDAVAHQLVVLDQRVIRVFREGERRQIQRVEHRQAQQPGLRRLRAQQRPVVIEQVVPEHEPRTVREPGQLRQHGTDLQPAFAQKALAAESGADREDAPVRRGFEIEEQRVIEQRGCRLCGGGGGNRVRRRRGAVHVHAGSGSGLKTGHHAQSRAAGHARARNTLPQAP